MSTAHIEQDNSIYNELRNIFICDPSTHWFFTRLNWYRTLATNMHDWDLKFFGYPWVLWIVSVHHGMRVISNKIIHA